MPYHEMPHPPRRKHRTVENLTTPATIYASNGSILTVSFPCFYQEIHRPIRAMMHCKDWHDHVGVPSPNHPDHSCQPYHEYASYDILAHKVDWRFPGFNGVPPRFRRALRPLIDMKGLIPIHFPKEGYERVYVAVKNKPEGLDAVGFIDPEKDHVIKVVFDVAVDDAEEVAKDYLFSVVVEGQTVLDPSKKKRRLRNVAARGLLHIEPGILSEYQED